jgi:hypothetical protein
MQGAEKCLPAVGGMARLNDMEFYDLHYSPDQGRSGEHGRGKMHEKYDRSKGKENFKIKVIRNGIEERGLDSSGSE